MKKWISLCLCAAMLLSLLPVPGYADEPETPETTEETVTVPQETVPEQTEAAVPEVTEEAVEDPTEEQTEAAADESSEETEAVTDVSEEVLVTADASEPAMLAQTVSGTCGANLTWVLDDSGTLTISGTGAMTNFNSTYFGPWSNYSDQITQVVIGAGVTSIGNYAFRHCSKMTGITIPDTVTSMGKYAFSGCGELTSIHIPGGIKAILSSTFYECRKLASVTIGEGLETIGVCAFEWCSGLKEITLPSTLTQIGEAAFMGCSSLASISLPGNVACIELDAFDSCTALKSVYIPASVTTISADYANTGPFFGCSADLTIYCGAASKPAGWGNYWNYYNNTSAADTVWGCESMADGIWKNAASFTGDVVIPDGITQIPENIFANRTDITSVTIPASVTSIGSGAFAGCSNLRSVIFRHSVGNTLTIGAGAFRLDTAAATTVEVADLDAINAAISGYDWDDSRRTVIFLSRTESGEVRSAMGTCGENLTWMLDENGVLTISGTGAMHDYDEVDAPWSEYANKITSVVLESGVTSIGNSAFQNCAQVTGASIPQSVTKIGRAAFYGCGNLKDMTIPDGVTEIEEAAFDSCRSLESVTIPEGVTKIGAGAFHYCVALSSITIPGSVTIIDNGAFNGCTGVSSITFQGSAPVIGIEVFTSVTAAAYYPSNDTTWTEDVKQNYGGTITWKPYGGIASGTCGKNLTWVLTDDGTLIISGTGKMDNYAYNIYAPWCDYSEQITSVVLESGVTSIGSYAFYYFYSNLTNISIPKSITREPLI